MVGYGRMAKSSPSMMKSTPASKVESAAALLGRYKDLADGKLVDASRNSNASSVTSTDPSSPASSLKMARRSSSTAGRLGSYRDLLEREKWRDSSMQLSGSTPELCEGLSQSSANVSSATASSSTTMGRRPPASRASSYKDLAESVRQEQSQWKDNLKHLRTKRQLLSSTSADRQENKFSNLHSGSPL